MHHGMHRGAPNRSIGFDQDSAGRETARRPLLSRFKWVESALTKGKTEVRHDHRSLGLRHAAKPVECMKRPIENNSSPGQAVYEPFSGSGTTIIAAEVTGRACYAIELSPAYVDVAVHGSPSPESLLETRPPARHSSRILSRLKVDMRGRKPTQHILSSSMGIRASGL
jgi:hypothetical protein